MPQYIESPTRKVERTREEKKARRQASREPAPIRESESDDIDSEEDALGAIAEAISRIHPGDITEVKALKSPPQDVINIFVAFGNFFRIGDHTNHDWASCQKFLGDATNQPVLTLP